VCFLIIHLNKKATLWGESPGVARSFLKKLLSVDGLGGTGLLAGERPGQAIRQTDFRKPLIRLGLSWNGRFFKAATGPGKACDRIVFLITSVPF
jgi:hypothetical protein